MKKPYFLVRDDDSAILSCMWYDDPDAGPGKPLPLPPEGTVLVDSPLALEFTREGRSDTSVAYWQEGAVEWIDTASLEALRDAKKLEINKCRELANSTYFEFQEKRIACDALSWKDILSANCLIALTGTLPQGWPGGWKTIDNSYVAIPDVATWTQFIGAMVSRGTAHFNHSQQLKSLLAAAETPEQIAAIKWETLDV